MLAPTYVSENSPRAIRGFLVGFFQLLLVLGGMTAYFINYGSLLHLPVSHSPFTFRIRLTLVPTTREWQHGWSPSPANPSAQPFSSSACSSVPSLLVGLHPEISGTKPAPSFLTSAAYLSSTHIFNRNSSNCAPNSIKRSLSCKELDGGTCRRSAGLLPRTASELC